MLPTTQLLFAFILSSAAGSDYFLDLTLFTGLRLPKVSDDACWTWENAQVCKRTHEYLEIRAMESASHESASSKYDFDGPLTVELFTAGRQRLGYDIKPRHPVTFKLRPSATLIVCSRMSSREDRHLVLKQTLGHYSSRNGFEQIFWALHETACAIFEYYERGVEEPDTWAKSASFYFPLFYSERDLGPAVAPCHSRRHTPSEGKGRNSRHVDPYSWPFHSPRLGRCGVLY